MNINNNSTTSNKNVTNLLLDLSMPESTSTFISVTCTEMTKSILHGIKSTLNESNYSKPTSTASSASNEKINLSNMPNTLATETIICYEATVALEFALFYPSPNYSFLKSLRNNNSDKMYSCTVKLFQQFPLMHYSK